MSAESVMTDEQILAHQRAKHGNPYMPLSMAKKMQRFERKWAHDDRAAQEEGTGRDAAHSRSRAAMARGHV